MGMYYVGSNGRWFVCNVRTKRNACSEGVREWGRGVTNEVRKATPEEVRDYENMRPHSLTPYPPPPPDKKSP